MIGQGVLRECLLDERVQSVIAVVRAPLGVSHPKLRELMHRDFTDFSSLAGEFKAVDACFFCLGVSSAGKGEDEYRRITYDYTLAAASARAVSGLLFEVTATDPAAAVAVATLPLAALLVSLHSRHTTDTRPSRRQRRGRHSSGR